MCAQEEEEEEPEFIRIHGYYRGTQGARCYTDGASLQPDESEGCSPVSVVGLIRLCAPLGRLTTLLPTSMLSRHGCRRSKWPLPSRERDWCLLVLV